MGDDIVAVGMRYRGNHIFRPDNDYKLLREPTNSYDPNAIKIMFGARHVAYVARDSQYMADLNKVYKLRTAFVPGSSAAYLYPAYNDVLPPPSKISDPPKSTAKENDAVAIQAARASTLTKRMARLKRMLE